MSSTKKPLGLINAGPKYLGPALEGYSDYSQLANVIFERYDKDRGGQLGQSEIANILIDMYRSMGSNITPTKSDIDQFARLLDANRDGKVDNRDMETTVQKQLKVDVSHETLKVSTINNITRSTTGAPTLGGTTTTTTSTLTTSMIIR